MHVVVALHLHHEVLSNLNQVGLQLLEALVNVLHSFVEGLLHEVFGLIAEDGGVNRQKALLRVQALSH